MLLLLPTTSFPLRALAAEIVELQSRFNVLRIGRYRHSDLPTRGHAPSSSPLSDTDPIPHIYFRFCWRSDVSAVCARWRAGALG
ncbi:hypothetical protein FB45DRAFT_921877 [Roridomyces roridus]|uniref:Secreted protein n=1 Tax=Roridomyces roridus TaxID=1738132 RepID=A0AAD7BMK4_9AGAR|nr:hypothetical protein FB45DRAFT_921877 [Roridomyces roridus]